MTSHLRILALAGAASLATSVAAHAGDNAEAKEKLKAWYANSVADFVACDAAAMDKYSASDKTGYYPDSGELHDESSDEARQMEAEFCENGGKHELTYELADIIMLKDAALMLGTGHYKRTEPDGEASIDADYTFTELLVKEGGEWKFRHSHIGAILDMGPGENEGDSE